MSGFGPDTWPLTPDTRFRQRRPAMADLTGKPVGSGNDLPVEDSPRRTDGEPPSRPRRSELPLGLGVRGFIFSACLKIVFVIAVVLIDYFRYPGPAWLIGLGFLLFGASIGLLAVPAQRRSYERRASGRLYSRQTGSDRLFTTLPMLFVLCTGGAVGMWLYVRLNIHGVAFGATALVGSTLTQYDLSRYLWLRSLPE